MAVAIQQTRAAVLIRNQAGLQRFQLELTVVAGVGSMGI